MILTAFIKLHLDDEVTSKFIALLNDYGSWCRYTGCVGYLNLSSKRYSYSIDDESALILDKVFQDLKSISVVLYKITMLHYQAKLDALDIQVFLSTNKKYKKLKLKYDEIEGFIKVGTTYVFNKLKEETVCKDLNFQVLDTDHNVNFV